MVTHAHSDKGGHPCTRGQRCSAYCTRGQRWSPAHTWKFFFFLTEAEAEHHIFPRGSYMISRPPLAVGLHRTYLLNRLDTSTRKYSSDVCRCDAQMHSRKKSFNCNECSNKCTQTSHLKRHRLTHTGEKHFACKQCNYCCTTSNNLKSHMIRHTTNIRKYERETI